MLQNPNQVQLIVCISTGRSNPVRFDSVSDRDSEVSISIGQVWRGQGLAGPAIRVATGERAPTRLDRLHARQARQRACLSPSRLRRTR